MSQAFRFPTLNKNEQHQTLQERLDAAQRVGLQQGYEEGLAQGADNKQSELEQQMKQQIELRVS
jgi:flagellar biosynthesis/type III secretory pathway protein FliH